MTCSNTKVQIGEYIQSFNSFIHVLIKVREALPAERGEPGGGVHDDSTRDTKDVRGVQRSESSDRGHRSADLRARRVDGSRVQGRAKGADERERARSYGSPKSVHKRKVHREWGTSAENGRRRSCGGTASRAAQNQRWVSL